MKTAKEIRSMEILVTARWITLAEACAYARKSENTLKKLTKEGKIYGTKKEGEWTFDRLSIDSFFNEERNDRRLQLAARGVL